MHAQEAMLESATLPRRCIHSRISTSSRTSCRSTCRGSRDGTYTCEMSGCAERLDLLAGGEELLGELLARAQAGVDDLDVGAAGQVDEGAGDLDDLHGRAHVEHHDLAAAAHGTGLEHQLAGLGDEHEEALDVGVGDGDRATAGDLLHEGGHHRARASRARCRTAR